MKNTCEILLARSKRKGFLYRVVTGNETWIYFDNLKCKKLWVDPSQPMRNIHRKKVLLCILWDEKEVMHYELAKSDEIITGDGY